MYDYKQNTDGDLDFSAGDLIVAESTYQHQRDLLLSGKGHVRNHPEVGINAVNYILTEKPDSFLRATRLSFANDGMRVKKIAFDEAGELITDAAYAN